MEAAALGADEPGCGPVEGDLRRGVRAVAELVLQPLDPEARLRALDEEAREPGGRLGEDEKGVRHRRRAEPLVAVEDPRVAVAARGRLVRADVRAALTLGHRHPAERLAARQTRDPLLAEIGLCAQSRDGGERHRERAADARLDLRQQHEERCPRDVRTGPLVDPRERLHARLETEPEQRVPGRMELDLVDSLAVAVVRQELRRVLVREPAPLERLATEDVPERRHLSLPGRAALPRQPFDQRRVRVKEVVIAEWGRLIRRPCPCDRHFCIVPLWGIDGWAFRAEHESARLLPQKLRGFSCFASRPFSSPSS